MTKEEKIKILLTFDDIYARIISKSRVDSRFQEDIKQTLYEKLLKTDRLPSTELELLKYSKTMLKNLIFDVKTGRLRNFKLEVDRDNSLNLDDTEFDFIEDKKTHKSILLTRNVRTEDEMDLKLIEDCETYEDYEQFFISVLEDCLKDSFLSFEKDERVLIVNHLLLGYTAKELAKERNIMSQVVKSIIYKFRQNCDVNVG